MGPRFSLSHSLSLSLTHSLSLSLSLCLSLSLSLSHSLSLSLSLSVSHSLTPSLSLVGSRSSAIYAQPGAKVKFQSEPLTLCPFQLPISGSLIVQVIKLWYSSGYQASGVLQLLLLL